MATASPESTQVELVLLGDRLSALRLRPPDALADMERSLSRHGQLTPIACGRGGEKLEVLDGFMRLYAARTLGWPALRAEIHEVAGPAAKLMLWQSNARRVLSEIEEAWVVRALYREDKLDQPRIAQLLCRHKSWVCRRLVLAEGLADVVEADVRLGLLSATAAREVGRLPRGNQADVAQVIARRGLTTRQASRLVEQILAAPDEPTRMRLVAEAARAVPGDDRVPGPRPGSPTPAEVMVADATALSARATRLHARLLERPLASLGSEAERVVGLRLGHLTGVLGSLCRSIEDALAGRPCLSVPKEVTHVPMEAV